jgi:hypothetical protein
MPVANKRSHAGGGPDAAAALKGKAVLVPSSALAALEQVYGPDRKLHGKIKVDSLYAVRKGCGSALLLSAMSGALKSRSLR